MAIESEVFLGCCGPWWSSSAEVPVRGPQEEGLRGRLASARIPLACFLDNEAALLLSVYDGLGKAAIDEYLAVLGTEAALGAALNWYRANMDKRTFTSDPIGLVTVDTLFIWSDADSAVCSEPAQATADFVLGPYRFETIAGTDHWVPENAAEAVSALLLEHLAK